MCSNMAVAVSPRPEILSAFATLVRLFTSMRPLVSAKSDLLIECCVACVAFERLLPMRGLVSWQIGGPLEALVADFTAEAFLFRVASLVVLQLLVADKRLVAVLALVGLFVHVGSHVNVEPLWLFKAFATHFTHEVFDVAVDQLVLSHALVIRESLSTDVARVRLDVLVAQFM